jgi:DNA-binding transcriptional LysR family regulator
MDLDLRLLRHARAVADHASFAKAAKAMHISQPALSRSIQQLERLVGSRLVERGTGRVEPTDVGSLLLERARDLLARAEDLGREVALFKGVGTGELRVGAGVYPAEMMVGEAVTRVLRGVPDLRLQVVVSNWSVLIGMVRKRELDMAVAETSAVTDDRELHITPFAMHQGYLVVRAGHPLLGMPRSPGLVDALAYPFISSARLSPRLTAPMLKAVRRARGQGWRENEPLVTIACESLPMMKEVVAGTDAVALLPLTVISDELRAGRLAVLPIIEPWLHGRFGVIRLANRSLPPAGESLLASLHEVDAEVAAEEAALARTLVGKLGATAPRRRTAVQVKRRVLA